MARKPLLLFVSLIAVWAASMPCPLAAEENQAELGSWASKLLTSPAATGGIEPDRSRIRIAGGRRRGSCSPIAAWNLAGNLPLRNGVERTLPEALLVVLAKMRTGEKLKGLGGGVLARSVRDDATVWGVAIRVEECLANAYSPRRRTAPRRHPDVGIRRQRGNGRAVWDGT